MILGGAISGTVFEADGTTRVSNSNVRVAVYQGNPCGIDEFKGDAAVDGNGNYTIFDLAAGDYFLRIDNGGTTYVEEFYTSSGSVFDCNVADLVSVTVGVNSPGRDFQLELGGLIAGALFDRADDPASDTNNVLR